MLRLLTILVGLGAIEAGCQSAGSPAARPQGVPGEVPRSTSIPTPGLQECSSTSDAKPVKAADRRMFGRRVAFQGATYARQFLPEPMRDACDLADSGSRC